VRSLWLLVVIAVVAARVVPAAQSAASVSESDVKAAYLYQFSNYVEWPTPPAGSGSITTCILGDAGVAGALQKIARDESGAGRKVVVRQLTDAPQAPDCHILFVGRAEEPRLGAILKALEGKPTLTAADDMPFLRRGGIVAFVVQDRKIRFSVSLAAAQAAHLKISSQLLRHAVQVIR
jgi:hypothetical protein